MTAGGVEPRHTDTVALFDNNYSCSDCGDQADGFVAGNKRKRRLDRPIPVCGVEVSVANATRLRLHHDLSNSRSWDVPLTKHKRLSETLNHCRVHLSWCHGVPLFKSRISCNWTGRP